jgi:squalene-hopene/tetraprenyl-beta-curcumene cyclase
VERAFWPATSAFVSTFSCSVARRSSEAMRFPTTIHAKLDSTMSPRLAIVIASIALPAFCQDWNPRLSAQYLDSRQKEWSAWPPAKKPGGPCVSCHTGMTYLFVRPALRRALGESQPTPYEKGLLDALAARAGDKAPSHLQGVEAVFSALFLALQNTGSESRQALDRMWSFQIKEGKEQGALKWFSAGMDPWETPDSIFYGSALAALAVGTAPAEYRDQPAVRASLNLLTEYLQREEPAQPLHNRLTLLWASSVLPDAIPKSMRRSIVDEILQKQQPDGGWTIESLGPWKPRPEAPPSTASNSYATGYAAFALQKAGVAQSTPTLGRALDWLRSHQDRQSGSWAADSMNKRYPPDSMEKRFMQDGATAFATLALLEAH